MDFKLSENVGIPVAYIDFVNERKEGDSKEQKIVDISTIGFTPKELIFDIAEDGKILGVELL